MKAKRRLLFQILAVVLLVAIGYTMTIIGRGHTIYLDSKTLEYDGQTYKPAYKTVVYVDGQQVAKLYDKDGQCDHQPARFPGGTPRRGVPQRVYPLSGRGGGRRDRCSLRR